MTCIEVERLLRAEIEAGLEEGYYLISANMSDGEGGLCPLGMVVRGEDEKTYRKAQDRVGMDDGDYWPFVAGFDESGFNESSRRRDSRGFYALGQWLRRDYLLTDG